MADERTSTDVRQDAQAALELDMTQRSVEQEMLVKGDAVKLETRHEQEANAREPEVSQKKRKLVSQTSTKAGRRA